jgi:flagellar biosynthesis chaperone FliJ
LTNLNRKLETARANADTKNQEWKEAQANLTEIQRDVQELTERRDKLSKVRIVKCVSAIVAAAWMIYNLN